ncbi:putative butyrophilin subfamily 2 member A3 [Simochromis diagramma]|uniref:putative butyrophilin subfamily 2 member A3 n=1 Tax=Simochromis diagramma TaxID=43689 RepID=UPI001A7EDC4B|nr:putative butyrophilin subfamily 2 member A3 [Simochromis diagramma]
MFPLLFSSHTTVQKAVISWPTNPETDEEEEEEEKRPHSTKAASKNRANFRMLICSFLFAAASTPSSEDQKIITAEPGPDVTLPCRAPNNNIIAVKWSRADLGDEYVLLYRDGRFEPDDQHPSFKNRVDLQDRQMKDGNVSLILKNMTTADNGTYECHVFMRGANRRKRGLLKTDSITTITLR